MSDPLRILFISTTFPDAGSPARGTYNAALCCALAEDHQVHAIAPRTGAEAFASWRKGRRYLRSRQLIDAGIIADYPIYWYTPSCLRSHYGRQMWWSVKRHVQRTIEHFQPDAVLSYWAHPEGEVGLLAAQAAGVPSAVIVGGTDVLLLPQERGRGHVIRRVLRQSSAVIGISDGLRQAALGLGVPADRAHTIYQGIDPDVFHNRDRQRSRERTGLPKNEKILLWVGRMVPIKGLDLLLNAFARVCSTRSDVRLCLVGDGPCRPQLESQAVALGIQGQVTFAGSIGHDRIADWYRAADATVLSSHSEGLPNVLRESLACGTPFVSTDVGSVREIADDRHSRLVPPQDVAALVKALDEILQPEHQAAAMRYMPRTWADSAADFAALLADEIARTRERNSSAIASRRERLVTP